MSEKRQVDVGKVRNGSDSSAPAAPWHASGRPATGAPRERPRIERFIEQSLHEAYAATLTEEVPARFTQLLDRLNASEGGGDGRAR
jgi:hypothetical protein